MAIATLNPTAVTYLNSFTANTNYSTTDPIVVAETSARALYRFDLSPFTGVTLNSATFRAYDLNGFDPGTFTAYVVVAGVVVSQATWNEYSTGNSWTPAGVIGGSDITSSIGSVTVGAGANYKTITITGLTEISSRFGGDIHIFFTAAGAFMSTPGFGASSNLTELILDYTAAGVDEIFTNGDTSQQAYQAHYDIAVATQAYSNLFAEFPVDFYGDVNDALANQGTWNTAQDFAYQSHYNQSVLSAFLNVSSFLTEDSLPTIDGTVNATNANDTSAASGTTTVNGTLSRTNGGDTSAASATTIILSTLARTNANDTSVASATPVSPSSSSTTNQNDTLAATGSVGGAVTGTVSYTNQNDTVVASGTTAVNGTLARSNQNDTLVAASVTTVNGSLAFTNFNDISTIMATTTLLSSLTRNNNNDTLAAQGSSGNPVVGTKYYSKLTVSYHRLGL